MKEGRRGHGKDRGPTFSETELRRGNLDRVIAAETQAAQLLRENEWLHSEVERLDRQIADLRLRLKLMAEKYIPPLPGQ